MRLYFCSSCRIASPAPAACPSCGVVCDSEAQNYIEMLLETILSKETNRAGMAVDVLTKWLHEPRAIVPLSMLLEHKGDPYLLVLGARGLGWLGNPQAVPALVDLLLDKSKPYVARIAAAQSLGLLQGEVAQAALQKAKSDPISNIAQAADQALNAMSVPKEVSSNFRKKMTRKKQTEKATIN
jgi:HEAT repeat protein